MHFFAPRATSDTTKRVCVVRSALVSLAKRSWCALTQTAIVFTNTGRHFYHLVKRFVTREAMFFIVLRVGEDASTARENVSQAARAHSQ